jgi:hypothetical protein
MSLDSSIAWELWLIGLDDVTLIDQLTGTGNTGTGANTGGNSGALVSSKYPGCTKSDIVGANGKVIAACDDPWVGDWWEGKCAANYHVPTVQEMRDLFASQRIPGDMWYNFVKVANQDFVLTSGETDKEWRNIFYALADTTIVIDRITKEYEESKTPVNRDNLLKKLWNKANDIEYHFMHIPFGTPSFSSFTKDKQGASKFKLRCMRDTVASTSEMSSTVDIYAYIYENGTNGKIALWRDWKIYYINPFAANKNVVISNKEDYVREILSDSYSKEQILATMTRELFTPLVEFLNKHPEQLFFGTTGEARIEKLKKDFGYISKVTYSMELPTIAKDYVKTTDFTKYIYAVLISSKNWLTLTYDDFLKFVSCAEWRCIRSSPEYKFFEEYRAKKNATTIYPIYELIWTSDAQLLDDVRYTKIPVIWSIDSNRAHIYWDYYDLRKGFSNDFSLYYPQMDSHRTYTDVQLKTIMNYYLDIAEELINGYTVGFGDSKLQEILAKVYGEKADWGIVMNNHIHPAPYGKDVVANLITDSTTSSMIWRLEKSIIKKMFKKS